MKKSEPRPKAKPVKIVATSFAELLDKMKKSPAAPIGMEGKRPS